MDSDLESPNAKRRKTVINYEYDGKKEADMRKCFARHIKKEEQQKIDPRLYEGVTLDAARDNPIQVPSGGITLTSFPRTSSVELSENFVEGINRIECTELIRAAFGHLNRSMLYPYRPMFLRGPGGVGKTTTLIAVALESLRNGYVCLFIQLKQFTKLNAGTAQKWAQCCLADFASDETFGGSPAKNPWRFIEIDQSSELSGVSCYEFLTMMSKICLDVSESLFAMELLLRCLSVETKIPVVICLDQWNSMENDHWKMGKTLYDKRTHPIAKPFLNWEINTTPVIFQALSSSCGADVSRGSDGNGTRSHHRAQVWPLDVALRFINFVKTARKIDNEGGDEEVAKLCGFLPREIIRYYVTAKGDKEEYLLDSITHYKHRVSNLMRKDSKESLQFSAYVYMHKADWKNMPESWSVSGVMQEGGGNWVCKAAREEFFRAFRGTDYFSGALAALEFFAGERPTHGAALELAMIHHFNVRRKFEPQKFCTDLNGVDSGSNLSFQCSNIEFISKDRRDSMTELVDNTVYILWEGAAVVDFFIHESNKHYAWLQISKSQYNAHKTKAEHMFEPANNYPIDNATRKSHSPYSYFMQLMGKPYQRRKMGFQNNEYYFYLTPNKPNKKLTLEKVEKKNCLLVAAENFRNLLDEPISSAIKSVFDDVGVDCV